MKIKVIPKFKKNKTIAKILEKMLEPYQEEIEALAKRRLKEELIFGCTQTDIYNELAKIVHRVLKQ
jgi:hypothetical protein